MKNILKNLAFVFVVMSLICLSSFAASPGALDFSFGGDGLLEANFSVSTIGNDVLVQPDGKILVGGTINTGVAGIEFYVARYNSNGVLDTSFNSTGVVTIDFPNVNGEESGGKIAIQTDGKILIAGTGGGQQINISRLNNNGTLDTTFDGDGKLNFFNLGAGRISDVDIANDGKIVLTKANTSGLNCFSITRLTTSGSLDTSFNTTGNLNFDPTGIPGSCGSQSSIVQSDGKILTVGFVTFTAGDPTLGVVRLNLNGTLDATFDGDGVATPFLGSSDSFGQSIAIQPDGKFVVSGNGFTNTPLVNFFIARLNTNGSLDTAFDTDGKVTFQESSQSNFLGMECLLQPNGKITVSARSSLFRLNSNGSFDNSFGQGGVFKMFNIGSSSISSAIQPDGKILTVGSQDSTLLLTRHTANIQPTQPGDFDGDAFTDSAVYRPTTGNWFILNSSNNTVTIDLFGANGDIPIDGDFDGDGKSDVAIYRPSQGTWFFKRSSDATILGATFGGAGDRPIPGDYDKDGKTDIAFFRPGNGNWFVLRSSTNFSTFFAYPFGQAGDIPLTIGGL